MMTIGADGQITLSLVQKVDAIDNKTDQLLAMQKAASMGHLLATTPNEISISSKTSSSPAWSCWKRKETKSASIVKVVVVDVWQ